MYVLQRLGAVIKNKKILKCLLMMVISLLLVLNFSIGVSASTSYDRQDADACITISQRLSVKTSYGIFNDYQCFITYNFPFVKADYSKKTTIPNLNRLSAILMSADEGEGSESRSNEQ
jgi:hypothetical protein